MNLAQQHSITAGNDDLWENTMGLAGFEFVEFAAPAPVCWNPCAPIIISLDAQCRPLPDFKTAAPETPVDCPQS